MTTEKIEENEQWKLTGDCTKCRRSGYCSKPCTRCNRRKRAELKRLIARTMNTMTGGVMSDVIEKSMYGKYL